MFEYFLQHSHPVKFLSTGIVAPPSRTDGGKIDDNLDQLQRTAHYAWVLGRHLVDDEEEARD